MRSLLGIERTLMHFSPAIWIHSPRSSPLKRNTGCLRIFCLALVTTVPSLVAAAQMGDPDAIQRKLDSIYIPTKTTADRTDIVTPGSIVVLHAEGMVMYAVSSPLPPSNSYKNGKIVHGLGGLGRELAITAKTPEGGTSASYAQRKFVPGEKCWTTGIAVLKDGILIHLYSDPYNEIRYYGDLKIPFPTKKVIPFVEDAMRMVADVITVAPAEDQVGPQHNDRNANHLQIAGQYATSTGSHLVLLPDGSFNKLVGSGQAHGTYAADGNQLTLTFAPSGFTEHYRIEGNDLVDVTLHVAWNRTGDAPAAAPVAPVAPPAVQTPAPEIAPPPPPPDTPPPSVTVGETRDDVIAAFGQPLKTAKIGVKEILSYKDMKVTLLHGKVTNVQ
jgi:hypothetical protein